MAGRKKTAYPGVFFREVKRVGSTGTERVYYVVFKKDGKVYEEKVGRQYVDAMTPAKASRVRAERIEGKRPSRKEIREANKAKQMAWTIDKLWQEYKGQNFQLKSLSHDESRYRTYLKASFGDKEPGDIIPLDVDRLRIRMLKTKSPQTTKLTLSLLRRVVNFGVNKQLCKPLPFKIALPRVNNETTEDLSQEQLIRLLKAIDSDPHPVAGSIMKMALFTGMRRGEMFNLKWEDVNFEKGFIAIVNPKSGSDEKIPLNDGAKRVLELQARTGSPYVFPGRNGAKLVNIAKPVNRIKKNAGLPKAFRPLHGLRHLFASMLASSGKVDMYQLQRLLTHKDARTTQRYTHLRDEALRSASNVADEIINKAINQK